ncbi:MAG TPA: GNAT family N-acetyltransferase [Bacillales bacterium]
MTINIHSTPWDAKAFGIDTYELENHDEETLRATMEKPGHFTVKIDPLASKSLLHEYGFYYCDTLLKPYCWREKFNPFDDEKITLSEKISVNDLIKISNGAYHHGRFHRDFRISREKADIRYDRWLNQLYEENRVWALLYNKQLAGFFAYHDNHVLLQALDKEYQGRGLAKYFWTSACRVLFDKGYEELTTSISACNLVMANLVTSLGFRFGSAVDIYHKYNP